ncbi:MAG: hypothetical protein WCK15_07330 [Pirellula sp.]
MSRLFIAMRWKRVLTMALNALLAATFSARNDLHAQSSDQVPSGAVTSSDFLRSMTPGSVTNLTTSHPFPIGPFAAPVRVPEAESQPAPAAHTPSAKGTIAHATATAEYQVPVREYGQPSQEFSQPVQEYGQPGQESSQSVQESSQIFGSGVASSSLPQSVDDSRSVYSPDITTRIPHAGSMATGAIRSASTPRAPWRLRDWMGLDPIQPNILVGYEVMHLRRSNDSGGDASKGGDFGRMDPDTSCRVTVARLLGSMEQVEFVFTGPFHWGRNMSSPGPVDSNLDFGSAQAGNSSALNAADDHRQSQTIKLASYEVNRRTSGDELSSYLVGLRILDHNERYHLESTKGASTGDFRLSTDNVLAGGQIGLSLSRPLSQRFSLGASMSLGAYFDFASGSFQVLNNSTTLADKRDHDFRVTWMAQPRGFLNYRVTENSVLYAGYEGWYFRRLATAADQRLGNVLSSDSFALRTRDDQLFYGWTAGISAKF